MDKPEHLVPNVSSRGFDHMPIIDTWSGYEFPPGRFMDFEVVQPHKSGEVRVYESSDAMIPSIWLNVNEGGTELVVMVTVDNARRLGEQLIELADHHYQSEGS